MSPWLDLAPANIPSPTHQLLQAQPLPPTLREEEEKDVFSLPLLAVGDVTLQILAERTQALSSLHIQYSFYKLSTYSLQNDKQRREKGFHSSRFIFSPFLINQSRVHY